MKTKGKDRMTEFELEMRTFTNKDGDDFLFIKTDGSYFAFKKIVAKKAIGHALGMTDDEINNLNTRQIGGQFWGSGKGNGGKAGQRKADRTAAHAH
jgi:hypothetical protein